MYIYILAYTKIKNPGVFEERLVSHLSIIYHDLLATNELLQVILNNKTLDTVYQNNKILYTFL